MLAEANPFRYVYMRPPRIAEVLAECPVAIQPTGLLEWHGNQNPLGLDGLVAQYICERAIVKLNAGALMPTNFVGTYGYAKYPGGVVYDETTVEHVFLQMYKEMMKLGFKVILILTGHWGPTQEGALKRARDAAEALAATNGLQVKLYGMRWADFLFLTSYGGHAQDGETSMAWRVGEAYGIPLVDVSGYVVGKEYPPLYPIGDEVPSHENPEWTWLRDLTDPSICSPEIGEQFISVISDGISEELKDAWQELAGVQ
jgi:creatinine amidohydrolase